MVTRSGADVQTGRLWSIQVLSQLTRSLSLAAYSSRSVETQTLLDTGQDSGLITRAGPVQLCSLGQGLPAGALGSSSSMQ